MQSSQLSDDIHNNIIFIQGRKIFKKMSLVIVKAHYLLR